MIYVNKYANNTQTFRTIYLALGNVWYGLDTNLFPANKNEN